MAQINPKDLNWSAPTEDTNHKPITEPLNYTLVDVGAGADIVSFPGTLNPDGKYSMAFADLSLEPGRYSLGLRAFYAAQPELQSELSNTIQVLLGAEAPKAPFGFAAV